jgi:hypothetical protein
MVYKFASMVLANHVKKNLPQIISKEPSTFVPGRLITGNVATSYECMHSLKAKKNNKMAYCFLKLDM